MTAHVKKVINALSDHRFPPQTFAHEMAREPLETQEKFIYSFMRYLELLTSYNRRGWMRGDLAKIAEWCDRLVSNYEEKDFTDYHHD